MPQDLIVTMPRCQEVLLIRDVSVKQARRLSEHGDDESEYGGVDDGQSDISFPSIDDLLRLPVKHKDAASNIVITAGRQPRVFSYATVSPDTTATTLYNQSVVGGAGPPSSRM
ncbi:hypothetical protein B0T25DRAFT_629567 [Lasiosphaeria hispida]|uniref:Uncharacterized protein n=1 Tax=Lasiosphaeria hispida TaxID=260671 RepID=A0AAJ0MIM3_9PEZI|nr:hypothetical protein B0T25DRAFT_629567 [Lasiosphaeria hispida]